MNAITLSLMALVVIGLGLFVYAVANIMTPIPVTENGPALVVLNSAAGGIPDKCKVPEGYTEQQWKEHLGHHPDRYADCFQYFP